MIALIRLLLGILASPFKSKSRLEAENAALRQQLIVLRRKAKGRAPLTNADRWFFVLLYRWFPSILEVLTIIRPETLVRWHRVGPRRYWRWKSREQRGWPPISGGTACADPAHELEGVVTLSKDRAKDLVHEDPHIAAAATRHVSTAAV